VGIPQQYSVQLPQRCLALIDALLPQAREVRMPGEEDAGPLVTTFILAMSTPVLTLPIERVERHRGKKAEGYVDERHLSDRVAEAIERSLGGSALERSKFFQPGVWRFAAIPHAAGLNFARNFPEPLVEMLNKQQALEDAAQMPASKWSSCLRNALAHGGVIYLDEAGQQSHGMPTEHIAFVSGKPAEDRGTFEELRVLRISRDDYIEFVHDWVRWLEESGLSFELAA
jgi:hypothetical protein